MKTNILHNHLLFSIVIALYASVLSFSFAQEVNEIEMRVYNIEKKLNGKTPLLPVDSKLMNISGYLSAHYSVLQGEGYKEGESKDYFREQMLMHSIIFSGELSSKAKYLFSPTLLYLDNIDNRDFVNKKSSTLSSAVITRAYGIYEFNRYFNVLFGRFFPPAGSYFEAWDWISDLLPMPEFVRQLPPRGIVYNSITDGVHLYGVAFHSNLKIKYSLYGGYHSYLPSRNIYDEGLLQDFVEAYPLKFFHGGRLSFSFYDDKLVWGLNYQAGKRYNTFQTYGADINATYGLFGLRAEYIVTLEKEVQDYSDETTIVNNLASALSRNDISETQQYTNDATRYFMTRLDSNKYSFYAEPFYRLNTNFTLAGRYEYFGPNSVSYTKGEPLHVYSFSLVYDPLPSLRFKLSVQRYNYEATNSEGYLDDALANNPAAVPIFYEDTDQLAYNQLNPDYWVYHLSFALNF